MFIGSIVSLITPFNDNNDIDEKALREMVEWHISEGTDGIVCLPTYGELSFLSNHEKLRVLRIVKSATNNKIPVIANISNQSTQLTLEMTKKVMEVGIDGGLVVFPYYDEPNPPEIIRHFIEISSVGLPIIIHHLPEMSDVNIFSEDYKSLTSLNNIVAIKHSYMNLNRTIKNSICPVLCGEDSHVIKVMQKGGKGSISIIANIIPSTWQTIIKLCLKEEFEKANSLYLQWRKLLDIFEHNEKYPIIKYALSLLGKCNFKIRNHKYDLPLETKIQIKDALLEYNLI